MIPTTISSSPSPTPPPATTTIAVTSNHQKNVTAIFTGIAALILEGRAIAEDEFQRSPPSALPLLHIPTARPSPIVVSAGSHETNIASPFHVSTIYSVAGASGGGRQSPKPSTSRAAASPTPSATAARNAINITTNPQTFGCAQSSTSAYDEIIGDAAAFSQTATHQRWTQKLCQLRQASPAASAVSRDCGHYDRQVAIEAGEATELVTLALNTDTVSAEKAADIEAMRRIMLNRSSLPASGGSAASSPGSTDNFLQSLQSLATTCLRGSSPAFETGLRYANPNALTTFGSGGAPKHTMFRSGPPRTQPTPTPNPFSVVELAGSVSGGDFQSSSQSQSCERWSSPAAAATSLLVSGYGAGGSAPRCDRREQFVRDATGRNAIPANAKSTAAISSKNARASLTYPQQGPHCEQFLRKMGLARGEALEAEEHICDMSYVNITCSRWRAYCLKMEAIIQRGEPVCIEVYLGPVRHKILLEQWILTQKDKVPPPPPTMTLPSLCSAIRSQLYFSQISAWCDLIKKSDRTIYETERVIFPTPTGAAGDLATSSAATAPTPGSSPSNASSNSSPSPTLLAAPRRPRLNIFYRIKQYDSTACFSAKPNVHNFPNVIIADGCSLTVCLKSLPRINGGIPRLGVEANGAASTTANATATQLKQTATTSAYAGVVAPTTTTAAAATSATTTSAAAAATASKEITSRCALATIAPVVPPTISPAGSCDIKKARAMAAAAVAPTAKSQTCTLFAHTQDQLERTAVETLAAEDYELSNGSTATEDAFNSFNCTLSHRERQLLKYRKRIQKRDKKGTRKGPTSHLEFRLANGGNHAAGAQPMDQGGDDEEEEEEEEDYEDDYEEMNKEKNGVCFGGNKHHEHPPRRAAAVPPKRHAYHAAGVCPLSGTVMISTGTQTSQSNCDQCGSEKALLCLNCDNSTLVAAAAAVRRRPGALNDMDSMDSCSISSSEIIHTPRNQAEKLLQAIQRTPKAAKKNKKQAVRVSSLSTPPSSSTAGTKTNSRLGGSSIDSPESGGGGGGGVTSGSQDCKRQKTQHNFSCSSSSAGTGTSGTSAVGGGGNTEASEEIACDEDSEESDGKPRIKLEAQSEDTTSSNSGDGSSHPSQEGQRREGRGERGEGRIIDQECFLSSTKLTPHIDRCSIYHNKLSRNLSPPSADAQQSLDRHADAVFVRSCTPPHEGSAVDADGLLVNCESSFKTPTNSQSQSATQQRHHHQQPHKQTPKPTLLHYAPAACYHDGAAGDGSATNSSSNAAAATTPPLSAAYNPILLRKCLPKVNLTPIFCNNSAGAAPVCDTALSSSGCYSNGAPVHGNSTSSTSCPGITTKSSNFLCHRQQSPSPLSADTAGDTGNLLTANNIPVQKSYSAPTLPNTPPSPLLSPRFAQQAAIYKRRSRHLSDHSDRSSLGSDEQISDEEADSAGASILFSPAVSPLKMRARAATQFGRRPLLANLEESLLQRRLLPKVEVAGFKVLLGASGGFCPTQLTIPAISYFYELHGEALSTPYVCEIRLPRKGYSVPRAGTVQATLLNPMGTVVRMFVIAYDMRDMPPLHQTFIRQRVLAEASVNGDTVGSVATAPTIEKIYNDSQQNGINGCAAAEEANQRGASNTTNIGGFSNNNDISNNNNLPHCETNRRLGHFISADNMKRLRYSIHLRFQTSRSGRLTLHTDIRLLISRRTDCDTAAAHAKGVLEAPNDLVTDTIMPASPKYSARQETPSRI